jgi:hypothetical protein
MRAFVAAAALAAVALGAPTWHIVDSDIATVDTGVAFTSDLIGYTAGASNGVGPQVRRCGVGGEVDRHVGSWDARCQSRAHARARAPALCALCIDCGMSFLSVVCTLFVSVGGWVGGGGR